MLSHLSLSANLMTAVDGFSPVPFTAHLWTISLEEQAYFIIPFLVLGFTLAGSKERNLAAFVGGIIAVISVGRVGFALAGKNNTFIFVLPFRADGIVLGAAAALMFEKRALPSALVLAGMFAACLLPFVLMSDTARNAAAVYAYPLLVLGCVTVLLLSQTSKTGRSLLGCKPLSYCGKISYGIYVYHLLSITIAEKVLRSTGFYSPVTVLVVTILLAVSAASASYHLFEKRFLKLKDRFAVVLSRPV
jgi:peptidoglycan/LPS O-acetylase OafA/YrhL